MVTDDFISVITEENVHNVVKMLDLQNKCLIMKNFEGTLDALNKENKIGVECKLNYAMASGEQKIHFYCLTYIKYMLISGVWDLRMGVQYKTNDDNNKN